MTEPARERLTFETVASDQRKRARVVVVSSDGMYAESLRSHLAAEFDVLMARNAGEAAAKAQAVSVDVAVVDLGSTILGLPALSRMRNLECVPVICCLATPGCQVDQSQFDFDFVLARPSSASELPDRIRFILAKAEVAKAS
jgi:DNA-binding response OmpR family regulator